MNGCPSLCIFGLVKISLIRRKELRMEQSKNTPALWDAFWQRKEADLEADRYDLAKSEASVRWRRMEEHVRARFESFRGLEVIEIGAGRGTNGALMARHGAHVTVLDYSETALIAA